MRKVILCKILFLVTSLSVFGQHVGLHFDEIEKYGITIKQLDSIYKTALNIDESKAVFKTEEDQELMYKEHSKLLRELGNFLSENGYVWENPTRCFNRIYYNVDGSIDYFLFSFMGKEEENPSDELQKEFERLLNLFIKDYQIGIGAECKFVQCGPATFQTRGKK